MAKKIVLMNKYMYYYNTIPLLNLSLKGKKFFTYRSFEKIPAGSLVLIDFGSKKTKGIVIKKTKKPLYQVKNITKIISKDIISPEQVKLAERISKYYLCYQGLALKLFIPKITKKIKRIGENKNISSKKKIALTKFQRGAAKKILNGDSQEEFLLQGPASCGKTEVIMEVIRKNKKKNFQFLIIIPEIFLSYQEISRYQQKFGGDEVVLLHSNLNSGDFYNNWLKIKEGKAKIIIATKIGVFSRFKNLRMIFVDEEQDISHKQWAQNPRYHCKKIAQWMKKIHNCKIIYISATPSMETIKKFQSKTFFKNNIQLPSLKTKKIHVEHPKILVEDLRKYYQKFKNNLTLSNDFIKNLKGVLDNKKIIFLIASQRGKSRYTICKNCNKIISCPNCKASLIEIGSEYQCIHCNYKINNLSSCPACRSMRLENVGFGTEKIEKELRKKFPKAKIHRLDQTIFKKTGTREKIYNDVKNKKIDILIGTQIIAKGLDLPHLKMAGVLNTENFNNDFDFRSRERSLGNLFQLAGRLNRPGSGNGGIFFIQTFNPESDLLDYLEKWRWKNFTKNELKQRKVLNYPPYSRLIKLTYKNKSLDLVEKNTKKVYNNLLRNKTRQISEIFPPYFGFIKKRRGVWEKNILLKVSLGFSQEKFKPFNFKNNWIYDIDPENIF